MIRGDKLAVRARRLRPLDELPQGRLRRPGLSAGQGVKGISAESPEAAEEGASGGTGMPAGAGIGRPGGAEAEPETDITD